jgi:hypothetical protein
MIFLSISLQEFAPLPLINMTIFIGILVQDSAAQAPISMLERREDFSISIL